MKTLIIDCDPGHDDAVALWLALGNQNKCKVALVTTVCGNNTLDKVTVNAHHILSVAGAKTLVARGADAPFIGKPVISSSYHGESGMDGPTEYPIKISVESTKTAVEEMIQLLRDAKEKVVIVALGPLTNIALLIKSAPQLLEKIEMLSLMGGGSHGNMSPYAEFNIFVDPEAAAIVFSSGLPIVMSGLDVTETALLYQKEYNPLREAGKIGAFFTACLDFYHNGSRRDAVKECMLHDPCAVAYVLNPTIFTEKKGNVSVVLQGERRGETIIQYAQTGNVTILQTVDRERLVTMVLGSIQSLYEQSKS